MKSSFLIAAAFAMALFVPSLRADSVDYSLTLTVATVVNNPCTINPTPGLHLFGCNLEVGDQFAGSFLVDDAVLSETGSNLSGSISDFFLQIGTVVWAQAHPFSSSDFGGFRGPPSGLNAQSPGFDVSGGTITGLEGGVHGVADIPFVDFFGNQFNAIDASGTFIEGTLTLTSVPEPGTILLLSAAVIGLIAVTAGSGWRKDQT